MEVSKYREIIDALEEMWKKHQGKNIEVCADIMHIMLLLHKVRLKEIPSQNVKATYE
jgi:hypothetical protein